MKMHEIVSLLRINDTPLNGPIQLCHFVLKWPASTHPKTSSNFYAALHHFVLGQPVAPKCEKLFRKIVLLLSTFKEFMNFTV